MTWHSYQLNPFLSDQLYKGLVAVPDQFGSDLVFAKWFVSSHSTEPTKVEDLTHRLSETLYWLSSKLPSIFGGRLLIPHYRSPECRLWHLTWLFLFSFLWWGETESTWHVSLLYQFRMIDDDECAAVGGMRIGRRNRSTRRKPTPVSTTNRTWPYLGLNMGHRSGKPATNRLSYGTALLTRLTDSVHSLH
jgi:hypothetical protein